MGRAWVGTRPNTDASSPPQKKKKVRQEALIEWLESLPTAEDYVLSSGFVKGMTPSVWWVGSGDEIRSLTHVLKGCDWKGLLYKTQTILEQSEVKGSGGGGGQHATAPGWRLQWRAVVNRRRARCGHVELRQQEAWALKGLVVIHDKHSSEDRCRVLQPMSPRSAGNPQPLEPPVSCKALCWWDWELWSSGPVAFSQLL